MGAGSRVELQVFEYVDNWEDLPVRPRPEETPATETKSDKQPSTE